MTMKSIAKATTRRVSTPSNNSGFATGSYACGLASNETPIWGRAGTRHGQLSVCNGTANGGTLWRMQGALGMVTLADIEAARRTIEGHVLRTPLLAAPPLSALTGADVFVKYENLQVTNSFKERGACVKLAALTAEERAPRRHRNVGRQSRAGGRLPCAPPRHSGDDRDAGADAVREGQTDRSARRECRARRRDTRGGAGARRSYRRRAQSGLGSSL